jgi:PTS system nitrogen regulatory IIA component
MNHIAPLLSLSRVQLDVDMASKEQLFEHASQLLSAESGITHKLILDSLIAREKLGSTGLGLGIAIPHGRIKGLKSAQGILTRLREPIAFDAPDKLPVGLFFMLFVPAQATDLHLQILSELAQLFSNKTMRQHLHQCPDSVSALTTISNWQP